MIYVINEKNDNYKKDAVKKKNSMKKLLKQNNELTHRSPVHDIFVAAV